MKEHDRKVIFSKNSDEWSTPQDFFDMLNKEFNFQLDPCATEENAKCPTFFTMEDDGLSKPWVETVFCNPPYSKTKEWLKKGYEESEKNGITVVFLVPSRTDTKYWSDYAMKANEIRFVKGRLKFGNQKNSAPFPSAVIIYKGFSSARDPKVSIIERK